MSAGERWARFWYGLEISRERLAAFRIVFFGLVGLDMWLQISHAPRYWAGGFNVSHFPALDPWLPTLSREVVLCGWLVQSWLALRAAAGVAAQRSSALLCVLYSATYFISQIDSYQHHYLMCLVFGICAFIPFDDAGPAPAGAVGAGGARPSGRVQSWALRLLLVQLSLVYFWATVAKLDPGWLSGAALEGQITPEWARQFVMDLARALGVPEITSWGYVSWGVIASELFLAVGLHVPVLALPVTAVGLGVHGGIELLGYNIGLFSYFMTAFYILAAPRWTLWPLYALLQRLRGLGRALSAAPLPSPLLALVSLGLGLGLLYALPLPDARWTLPVVLGLALLDEALGRAEARPQRAWAHLMACAAILGFHHSTDQARDYYKYLGGDTRRRGELDVAIDAYQRVTALDPAYVSGFIRLGDLMLRDERPAEAAEIYERAEPLEPDEIAHPLRAARAWARAGDGERASAAAERALALDPENVDARRLRQRWGER